jgi:DNA-binding MarR family transcriptional regulator/GNAT superfamily N-acetyltransferase
METNPLARRTEAVRRFNRFYTRRIGLLQEGLLKSPFSLTQARVIYELAHLEGTTATCLCRELGLDPGYLSRLLNGLGKNGLLEKRASAQDARQNLLSLTAKGREAFAELNAASRNEIAALLNELSDEDQHRLICAMQTIASLLDAPPARKVPYLLRPHQPGDMGWVIQRHGRLYSQEYGWNDQFEALVAEIAAAFLRNYDPQRERCWIAEMDGENVGSVFLVRKSETTAKLRLLLVEPKARGQGIGKRLVVECIRFARQTGYRKMVLWTNSVLHAARHIYEQQGFRLVAEDAHHSFGHDLVGQDWELDL